MVSIMITAMIQNEDNKDNGMITVRIVIVTSMMTIKTINDGNDNGNDN